MLTIESLGPLLASLPDGPIPLSVAVRLLGKAWSCRKISLASVYRWTHGGCRGVRLESVQVGGSRCVTRDGLIAFFATLSTQPASHTTSGATSEVRTSANRRRALASTDRRLDAILDRPKGRSATLTV
jgi:hypothetical protein